MKTIFIVNPVAGREDKTVFLKSELASFPGDHGIYTTKSRGDAVRFVKNRCSEHPGEEVRFIACGGDGTLNEVVTGAMEFPWASVSVYPCGSGNDYVKNFGGAEAFLDLGRLLNARERKVDLLRVNGDIAVNALHFGLDAVVAKKMDEVRRKPVIGGKNAYATGVVHAFLRGMRNQCRVKADGEDVPVHEILLCTVCMGAFVGGAYKCAPRAEVDDGLAEMCLMKPVSRVKFLKLMKYYKEGSHLDSPEFQNIMIYRRIRSAEVTGPEGFCVALDGELRRGTRFKVEVLPGALRFAAPELA